MRRECVISWLTAMGCTGRTDEGVPPDQVIWYPLSEQVLGLVVSEDRDAQGIT